MEKKRRARQGRDGRLSAMAPLANPYVPFQQEDSPMYDPEKAFIRGTLYSGLDLPFHAMVNNQRKKDTPMHRLQTLDFMIQELALYLDTHPEDGNALEMYRTCQQLYREALARYSADCRPLTHGKPGTGGYGWLDDPWPWEYAANKEG